MPRRLIGHTRDNQYDTTGLEPSISSVFFSGMGHKHQAWGALDSRIAITPGNLNDSLVYQIESLFRDVLFKETLLTAESATTTQIFCTKFKGLTNSYYSGAYIINCTRNLIAAVTSYDAASVTITHATIAGQTTGDIFHVFNINGSGQIDFASFDTAATSRSSWKGAFSINQKIGSFSAVAQIASEAGLVWTRNSSNKEAVKVLDSSDYQVALAGADILEVDGQPQVRIYETSTDEIFNDFRVNYRYDYLTGAFAESETLNSKTTSLSSNTRSGFRDGYTSYTSLCAGSFTKYKIQRPATLDLYYIRESETAQLKLKQFADWHTLQRYIVELDLVFNSTTAKLEEGDYILLNDGILPSGYSDSALFIIQNWIELPESQSYHVVLRETPWSDTI